MQDTQNTDFEVNIEDQNIKKQAKNIKKELDKINNAYIKIALFGQPGSGKSSIINKLVGENLAAVGITTDKTTREERYYWNGLELVDLPGYDTKKFPKETFFERFNIPQFDLFLCVFSEKFHQADNELFHEIKNINKVCIFVRNKRDMLWQAEKTVEDLEKEIESDLFKQINSTEKIVFTSCKDNYGLDKLQNLVYDHLDEAKKKRWLFAAKTYSIDFLDKKKTYAEEVVSYTAGLAAVNGLNPIPLLDVALDIGILINMTFEIRNHFGLTEDFLQSEKSMELIDPSVLPILKKIVAYGTKKGLTVLLQKFATRQLAKSIGKFIPIVGSIIGGMVGYTMAVAAGQEILDECYLLSKSILEKELGLDSDVLEDKYQSTSIELVDVDSIARNYMIFIDTSFLMLSQAESFIKDVFSKKLDQYNNKIFIIDKVKGELEKHISSDNPEKVSKAQKGKEILDYLESKNLAERYKESNNQGHADKHFLVIFTDLRMKKNLCLLARDNDLAADINDLKKQRSVESNNEIVVCYLSDKDNKLKIRSLE